MQLKLAFPFLLALPTLLRAIPTSTTLSSSANPAVFGHAVTLTAVVTPSTATGKVTFYDGVVVLETEPVVSGKAVFRTTLLQSGARSLKAYYEGDANDAASTSPILVQQVNAVAGSAFEVTASYPADDHDVAAVAAGDFNGDGKADLVAVGSDNPGYVDIFLGNGDGTFQPGSIYSNDNFFPQAVALADFNGDGISDIAVATEYAGYAGAFILIGNGDGTFQAPIGLSGFSASLFLAVADFNGDGKPDLLSGDELVLGNGDGTFQNPLTFCPGCSIVSAAVGDFNGDGKADVVFTQGSQQSGPGTASVMLGNGDGTFQPGLTIGIDAVASHLAVGDFNGDGKSDIAAAITVIPIFGPGAVCEVSILLGNGDGTLQPPVSYGNGAYCPTSIETADFNGDGKSDLAVGIDGGGSLNVLLGNGDGTFQPASVYAIDNFNGEELESLAMADFNGDGRADVAAGEVGGSNTSLFIVLNTAAGPSTTSISSSPNPSSFYQNVTFTAMVSPSTATGTITFYDGSTVLGTSALNAGTASFSTAALSAGARSITAAYGGDGFDAPSTSPILTQTVNLASTSVMLTSSPDPSIFRHPVTLTASVASPGPTTGTVTFHDGSTPLGTAKVSGGVATLIATSIPLGANSLTAAYGGDANNLSSTSAQHNQMVRDPTSIALSSSPNPSKVGQTVVLTAAVTPLGATGQVIFYVGSTAVGKATLSGGTAKLPVSALKAGEHELSANYVGTLSYGPSQSPVLVQGVSQ